MNSEIPRPRLLLVDDDREFGKIIMAQATVLGIDVVIMPSVTMIQKLQSEFIEPFDLLLVDYDLEDGTGFEAAEHFRSAAGGKPVVMISGTERPLHDKLAQLPNIIGFVTKWHRPREFLSKVLAVAEQRPGIVATPA